MTERFIQIDGSQGEGGGQILRSSLALAMVTGRPFRIVNIRAGRAKPGLMRQHLTCIEASAAICSAEVTGAAVGAQEVTFIPGKTKAGEYHFSIGTAGSTTMVLQAILPALLVVDGPSTIAIEGGTHNKAAPPFEFFERALVPILNRAGTQIRARLERHGFYPAGGGRIVVDVEPARRPQAVELLERGKRVSVRATAAVSRLPRSIAQRELAVLRTRLGLEEGDIQIVSVPDPVGPGNAVWVELSYEDHCEVFSAVGELAKSAETVAREVYDEVREFTASQKAVGPYLADQLMVPLTVLNGGRYSTGTLTDHARTNIGIVRLFGGRVELADDGVVNVLPLPR